jgi:hypothetical protein
MEVWFGRAILTAATLLMATVLALLPRMIAGDRRPLPPVVGSSLFSVREGCSYYWSFLSMRLQINMAKAETRVE